MIICDIKCISYYVPWSKIFRSHQSNKNGYQNSFSIKQPVVVIIEKLFIPCVSVVSDSATPWTVACQASLSMRILQARILEWPTMPSSRVASQPRFPALQADSLPSEPPRKPQACGFYFANMNCNFFKEVNVHYIFLSIVFFYHKNFSSSLNTGLISG